MMSSRYATTTTVRVRENLHLLLSLWQPFGPYQIYLPGGRALVRGSLAR